MSIALLLDMAADGFGDAPGVGRLDEARTYLDIQRDARRLAAWLGVRPAENTAYIGYNDPLFPVAMFGSALANRPFTPLNYRLPDADLRRIVARTAPSVAIVDDEMLPRIEGVEGVEVIGRAALLALLATAPDPADLPVEGNDIAILLFTSGTTGEPKAAVLRHANLTSYVFATVDFMSAHLAGEVALVGVPPYHIAGISAVLTSVYAGRRLVQLPHFSAEAWLDTVEREQVTHAMLVPTMLDRIVALLEQAPDRALPSLRHISYGGGRMPAALIARALARLPQVDFVNAYGLTETSSTIAVLTPDDHRAFHAHPDPAVARRLGSVGRPIDSIELKVVGPDGETLGHDAEGEIWVRGPQVSGEYLGKKAIREDGWFPTNDAGMLDEQGYLYVSGRLDDVIVRGGENISPGEIEDVLRRHPAIEDIAVLGLPDNQWGEKIVACVVLRAPVEGAALQAWARGELRSTRTPESFFFRDELPYNETGKLLRKVLRAELGGG